MSKILIKLNKSGNHVDLNFIEFKNKKKIIFNNQRRNYEVFNNWKRNYEGNLLLLENEVKSILNNDSYSILKDIHTYFEVSNNGNMVHFKITMLNFDLDCKKGTFEYRELWIPVEKFMRFYFHSDREKLLIFNKEPIYRIKIELRGNRIHQIRKNKTMYHKFLKILNRLTTWRYDKIVIVNDYEQNSFYFQTYNGENRAINGGIIWHKDRANYSIHT